MNQFLSFAWWLLGFFGVGFVEATGLLRVLATGMLINALTGPVGAALLMTGHERAVAITTGVVAVANIAGHVVFIQRYGAWGAAWVTAATAVVLSIALFALYLRYRDDG